MSALKLLSDDAKLLNNISYLFDNQEEALNCLAAIFKTFQQSFLEHQAAVINRLSLLEAKCQLLNSEISLLKNRQNPAAYNG